jgi:hypothetical protein
MSKKRAPNLGDSDIAMVAHLLDEWKGPCSWPLVIKSVRRATSHDYTRQALAKHSRIQRAFVQVRQRSRKQSGPSPHAKSRDAAYERLKEELRILRHDNDQVLARLRRWLFNAQVHNVSVAMLEAPLKGIDRRGKRVIGPVEESEEAFSVREFDSPQVD